MKNLKTEAILRKIKEIRKTVDKLSDETFELIHLSEKGSIDRKAFDMAYVLNQWAHRTKGELERHAETMKYRDD